MAFSKATSGLHPDDPALFEYAKRAMIENVNWIYVGIPSAIENWIEQTENPEESWKRLAESIIEELDADDVKILLQAVLENMTN